MYETGARDKNVDMQEGIRERLFAGEMDMDNRKEEGRNMEDLNLGGE